MQEHPIPQDITGYKFHIIGSMTLKQFGEVFLGVIIAGILFKTNLIAVIKWPLIMMSVGLGAAAAFLPIEERPLDHWIITFFRVLYKPTKFYWRKEPKIPDPFIYVSSLQKDDEQLLDLTPAKRQRIKEYVGSIPESESTSQDFTNDELSRMNDILSSFKTVQVTNIDVTKLQPKNEKPRIDVRVRKMRKPISHEIVIFNENQLLDTDVNVSNIYEDPSKNKLQTNRKEIKKTVLSADQVARDIDVPEEIIVKTTTQKEIDEKTNESKIILNDNSERSFLEAQPEKDETVENSQEAHYNKDLPFPIQPSEPNKVVGMVLSQNNELLTNAIVEIQTVGGSIARAVKTNALGQFFVTTPLKKGEYNIVVEKDGYQFQPQHLIIDNTIVPPMEIRSGN